MDKNGFGVAAALGVPALHPEAWVAPGAVVVGDVRIGRGAGVWYHCVLRSDMEGAWIEIGEDTNVQDGTVVHVDAGLPCRIGARVTIGHGAVLHAATIEDDCLIGMGAIVLSGATVGRGSLVAAGALVPERMQVPPGTIVAGVPAKIRAPVEERIRVMIEHGWRSYAALKDLHRGRR